MKQRFLICAVVALVGRGEPSDFHKAAGAGNIEAVKQHLSAGADVNTEDGRGWTALDFAKVEWEPGTPELKASKKEIADLLRKHGGKTGEELKAAGK